MRKAQFRFLFKFHLTTGAVIDLLIYVRETSRMSCCWLSIHHLHKSVLLLYMDLAGNRSDLRSYIWERNIWESTDLRQIDKYLLAFKKIIIHKQVVHVCRE